MPPVEFTSAQVIDLANHFLGPQRWTARVVDGSHHLFAPANGHYRGASWRAVFRAAGIQLPLRAQYVAKGASVMHGARAICTAVSNTTAKRIAAALNEHETDRRGI